MYRSFTYCSSQPDDLKIIHVAGTKGKGSTCAFCASILKAHGLKTGFFSSPHMISVRERIRIDGVPLSEAAFSHYFQQTWLNLQEAVKRDNLYPMPPYFRFLTLMALQVFSQEKVEAVVLEVGIGGRYDATNVVTRPVVTGISVLGYDHMALLGNTLREIAGQKAGIFKAGVPAFTSPQVPEAAEQLTVSARECEGVQLSVVPPLDASIPLGLQGDFQRINAALAVALCGSFLGISPLTSALTPPFLHGLQHTTWPGRAQTIAAPTDGINYFLDGAHTVESLKVALDWFQSHSHRESWLVFNCHAGRSVEMMLDVLADGHWDKVIFTTFVTGSDAPINPFSGSTNVANLQLQQRQQACWKKTASTIVPSIPETIETLKRLAKEENANADVNTQTPLPVSVFVVGSLYLVGGFLECLHENVR
jgi:folylpolyglutamate synthase